MLQAVCLKHSDPARKDLCTHPLALLLMVSDSSQESNCSSELAWSWSNVDCDLLSLPAKWQILNVLRRAQVELLQTTHSFGHQACAI